MRTTREYLLAAFVLSIGTIVLSTLLIPANASAAGAGGTWVSNVSGEGFVQEDVIYRWHYDIDMRLTDDGSYVYGTVETTLVQVDLKDSSYPPYPYSLPQVDTYNVEGPIVGSSFSMTVHGDGQDMMFSMVVNGTSMTGSGTYVSAGAVIHGVWDLKKSSSFGFGSGSMPEYTPIVSGAVIVIAFVAIGLAVAPVKAPVQPKVAQAPPYQPPYQPAQQWTTDTGQPLAAPDGATPVGGTGITYGTPPPGDRPLTPRDHFQKVSQQPPKCPFHPDTALSPRFFRTDGTDPGSWFCAKCNGFPWGKN